jgi:hypothetical protein
LIYKITYHNQITQQVIIVKNKDTGKEHTVCPFCFSLVFNLFKCQIFISFLQKSSATARWCLRIKRIQVFVTCNISALQVYLENFVRFVRCFSCAREDCELALRIPGLECNITECANRNCNGFMRLRTIKQPLTNSNNIAASNSSIKVFVFFFFVFTIIYICILNLSLI